MSSWTCTRLTLCTVAAVLLQAIGLLVFVLGFFPAKPALSGFSGPDSFRPPTCDSREAPNASALPPHQLRSLYQELSGIPASFDRLILMVVDGLPAEFLLGRGDQPPPKALMDAMPYTQSLLANGMAIGYHARAAPPTVTMPRLKAMVSGAIGGFLDVAFNFNTQALLDDNLLGQFFSIGWKMVMLGDETWLKLFPGLFTRHDGVSSFFVKDTVQVDHNVSRHLGNELNKDDWKILILHYLGLDHVGHVGGRKSVLMGPKLKEMDEVIKMIHLSTMLPEDNNKGQTLLMVVSDHGMTENGNHGGSSYEETDSLALFIGLAYNFSDYASASYNRAHQVDIAPTLALLFGVPIPKNNVGVLIGEIFNSLTDDHKLRALELNSWQLLRLLRVQLPGLSCRSFPCDGFSYDKGSTINECNGSMERKLCCLYKNAAALHSSLKSKNVSRCTGSHDYRGTVSAYYEFLRTASEWLSHRATDKPVDLLALGVAALLLSCLALLSILFALYREVYIRDNQCFSELSTMHGLQLDETFSVAIILILVISMGSSSMVEEEQYIWHFVTSTLYLIFFRKVIQSLPERTEQSSFSMAKEQIKRKYCQMCSIIVLLISERILRGWYQGGVNWTHLPDISKWLEQAGNEFIKLIQLASGVLLTSLSFFSLSSRLKREFIPLMGLTFFTSGILVLQHIMKYQDPTLAASDYGATLMAQIIYTVIGISTTGTVIALPWLMPVSDTYSSCYFSSTFISSGTQNVSLLLVGLREFTWVIGWAYVFFWCLLQLLLQQPINSVPILLLFVQIWASMLYYSISGPLHKQWVEVAALYYMGMAGHFSLGNSNALATIDVAGAFIGISSHSTLLSGILMFIITYASPMLVLVSMVMYISMKDTRRYLIPENGELGHILKMTVGFSCLVPLGLNSVLLAAYTIVLLLMQNHLFVWSVFSPKYLYVCATTVCVYIGVSVVAATSLYACLVFIARRNLQSFTRRDTGKISMFQWTQQHPSLSSN
ncbi:GPI ethanolamine phosphate transferase 2 [Malania oleifera]|uniref:GPI ethanolamine phosphate transferase 2 n=1 Tax=Malania oleifera TaxID=397392 RepID=UPI0025AEA127|nr:GPI ethanolamine phosphate transferase 2 [Malania oleifera]